MGGGSEAQATDQVSGVRKSNGQASCTYQPNPAGGPPTIPQALNRYAATAVGQPGVYQAADEDLFVSLLGATGQNALSAGGGMALSAYAYNLTGELFIQANNQLLARAGYQHLFRRVLPPGRGNSAFYYTGLVKSAGNRTYQTLATDQLINLAHLEAQVASKRWPVRYPGGEAFEALDDNVTKQFLRTGSGEFLAGFGINLLLAGPDLAAPWQNPYFSRGQRLAQNAVTVSGAAASAGAAVWVGNLAVASGIGGPGTFVLVTGTGVVVWVGWEYVVKPTVSWIAVASGLPDPYTEYRSLKPLGANQ